MSRFNGYGAEELTLYWVNILRNELEVVSHLVLMDNSKRGIELLVHLIKSANF